MADERAVDALDRAWNAAYEQNERDRLVDVLADDFIAVTADGRAVTKAQLVQPSAAPRSIAFSERSVQLFGTTAITRGRVYAKRDGRWQAVAVQVFAVVE